MCKLLCRCQRDWSSLVLLMAITVVKCLRSSVYFYIGLLGLTILGKPLQNQLGSLVFLDYIHFGSLVSVVTFISLMRLHVGGFVRCVAAKSCGVILLLGSRRLVADLKPLVGVLRILLVLDFRIERVLRLWSLLRLFRLFLSLLSPI